MEALSVALFVIGMVLVLAEIIMPGVILGLLGAGALFAGVWLAFETNVALAVGEIVVGVVVIPVAVVWGIRRMRLKAEIKGPESDETLPDLVGKTGEVQTDLSPSGYVSIDGKKYTASSVSGYIDKGLKVSVVKVQGNKVFVKAV